MVTVRSGLLTLNSNQNPNDLTVYVLRFFTEIPSMDSDLTDFFF